MAKLNFTKSVVYFWDQVGLPSSPKPLSHANYIAPTKDSPFGICHRGKALLHSSGTTQWIAFAKASKVGEVCEWNHLCFLDPIWHFLVIDLWNPSILLVGSNFPVGLAPPKRPQHPAKHIRKNAIGRRLVGAFSWGAKPTGKLQQGGYLGLKQILVGEQAEPLQLFGG